MKIMELTNYELEQILIEAAMNANSEENISDTVKNETVKVIEEVGQDFVDNIVNESDKNLNEYVELETPFVPFDDTLDEPITDLAA